MKLEWMLIDAGKDTNTKESRLRRIEVGNIYIKKKGLNWLVLYDLGNNYAELEDYINALKNWEICYKLKPNKPFSTYNLSTLFRTLAKASYSESDSRVIISNLYYETKFGFSIRPEVCRVALKKLGLDHGIILRRFFECSYKTIFLLRKCFQYKDIRQVESNVISVKAEYKGFDQITDTTCKEDYLPFLLQKNNTNINTKPQ